MSENVYQFIDVARVEPNKINKQARKSDFKEIYKPFTKTAMGEQADRCIECGNPYCQWECPVHNHIPHWLKLVKQGRLFEAAELSHQTNSLPEMCGRVCPQDRLCEGACTLNEEFGAVTIGSIEKYITDEAFKAGWRPDLSHVEPTDFKVAIIGAGPAGLACADRLVRQGVTAHVYDKYPKIGGLLTYGIPAFKLEKEVIATRHAIMEEMGVKFFLNQEIGKDVTFNELKENYDAVFLAVGTYQSVNAQLENQSHPAVYDALPFLINNTQTLLGERSENPQHTKGKRVVVLGGGDTAMDCVRSAIRQGASKVTCAYRRDESAMPGSRKEVTNAKEEGVTFCYEAQPLGIVVDGNDKVTGVKFAKMVKQNGRFELDESKTFILEADIVITAFGFRPHRLDFLSGSHVQLSANGTIKTLQGQRTNVAGVYAGGDIVSGSDLVVTAIFQGRQAADSIVADLKAATLQFHEAK